LYRGLLNGHYAGDGYHGLGLLYAHRDPATALGYLRAAVKAQPTRAEWRNDLGYGLISAGKMSAALPELATAVELSPDTEKYHNNLLILLILMKDEAGVSRLTRQWNLSTASLGDLRRQAQTLSKAINSATGPKVARRILK
jgi:Flp pilus assembly protein TadD